VFGPLGDSAVLQACGPVTCTHAVAFHRRAYDRLLAEIPASGSELDRFLRDDVAIDQYLSRRIADGTYRAVITSPRVASQPNLLDFETRTVRSLRATPSSGGEEALRAVALLELLARAAPAGVVAAELLVLARMHGLGHDTG
jgi:hypothetical protein